MAAKCYVTPWEVGVFSSGYFSVTKVSNTISVTGGVLVLVGGGGERSNFQKKLLQKTWMSPISICIFLIDIFVITVVNSFDTCASSQLPPFVINVFTYVVTIVVCVVSPVTTSITGFFTCPRGFSVMVYNLTNMFTVCFLSLQTSRSHYRSQTLMALAGSQSPVIWTIFIAGYICIVVTQKTSLGQISIGRLPRAHLYRATSSGTSLSGDCQVDKDELVAFLWFEFKSLHECTFGNCRCDL